MSFKTNFKFSWVSSVSDKSWTTWVQGKMAFFTGPLKLPYYNQLILMFALGKAAILTGFSTDQPY
jgi:hypothetical protein